MIQSRDYVFIPIDFLQRCHRNIRHFLFALIFSFGLLMYCACVKVTATCCHGYKQRPRACREMSAAPPTAAAAAVAAIDGTLTGSLQEHDVSEARKRRHRSTRRGQSATIRSELGGGKREGGVEEESSSICSSSAASTSAR